MAKVYLLLGSNVGNRAENLANAVDLLSLHCGQLLSQSALYETAAWGNTEQQSFYNQAIHLQTHLPPSFLLKAVKLMERKVGRVETTHWGPRVIDIDIILFGNEVIDLPKLKIPHPYMHERRFTLTPLAEIAPNALHPVFNKTVRELLEECADDSEVTKI